MSDPHRQTVCSYCSYRFTYNIRNETASCPICGATSFTKDLVPVHEFLGESEMPFRYVCKGCDEDPCVIQTVCVANPSKCIYSGQNVEWKDVEG